MLLVVKAHAKGKTVKKCNIKGKSRIIYLLIGETMASMLDLTTTIFLRLTPHTISLRRRKSNGVKTS